MKILSCNTVIKSFRGVWLALLVMSSSAFTVRAEYSAGYYDAMDGKSREALKAAAKECVSKHRVLVYMDLPNYWQYSDVYPDLVDGCRRWWEMYSNETYLIFPGQSPKTSFSANRMQREHSVPKSWWKSGNSVDYTPAYTDMWNLYPSDGSANMAKSNYPLGVVSKATFDNGCTRVGAPASGTGGGSGNVFEPADEYKGDFARGFFYMATVYDDLPWVARYWMFNSNSYPTLKKWAYEMLLQWSRQDPVSQKERLRNDAVEKAQGNRNPFVDFPELAEYIWGTRSDEVFRLSEQGGQVTPPITGPAEITKPVNNEALDLGQVAVGGAGQSWLVIKGKNLTSALSLRVAGADRDAFTISLRSIPASSINATGEYMLPVSFTPSRLGVHEASLSIYDGGLGSSIKLILKGEGCEVPALTRLSATSATDVTDYAYTANWGAAPEVVDYYVVTRTRYTEGEEESDELGSDTNSLRIEGRDPTVMETYSVRSSRLGFLSEASNVITVDASGVAQIYDDSRYVVIAPVDEGFRVLTGGEVGTVTVYDIAGRAVMTLDSLQPCDVVPLPRGIYIVGGERVMRPVKIVVE